jgi:hypothetical protein
MSELLRMHCLIRYVRISKTIAVLDISHNVLGKSICFRYIQNLISVDFFCFMIVTCKGDLLKTFFQEMIQRRRLSRYSHPLVRSTMA